MPLDTVNIRPGIAILSVLSYLNYRPWFALAEFVDNALQSYLDNRDALEETDGQDARLRLEIEFDPNDEGRLVVRDNAAGIYESEYIRAFRPAEIPPDRSGLCEFGMGMKNAACWFAKQWSVRTTALGETAERTISFDIDEIVNDSIEELAIATRSVASNNHYTELVLSNLHHVPYGKSISKIKEHLASIYRVFQRLDAIDLFFNGEKLSYEEPAILTASYYRDPASAQIVWKKDIDFDFGDGQRVYGFAALRAKASTSSAGFALFRRNRLIQGSGDDTYRPEYIFGKTNSFRYQRLFGELHLDGFEVSHTKDGFLWDEDEEPFLELLKEHLDSTPSQRHRLRETYPAIRGLTLSTV